MILKKIKIKNIRSYKEAEINFPEGSTLLMGDIGSGKTSILLAIEFALFGLQPSQRGSSLLKNNEDEGKVELEFEIDGERIFIERKLKRGSKAINQGETGICIGDTKIEGSVTEIKNKVISLLNYPSEFVKKTNDLYKFTVYTPQEEMKQIILEPPETRLNTLRHIFGIDKYKRIEENLDVLGVKMRQEIRLKESQIGETEQKNKELNEKKQSIELQKNKIKEIETEIQKIKNKRTEKEVERENLKIKIDKKRYLEKEKEKAEIMLHNKKEAINTYEKEISKLNQQVIEGKRFSLKQEDLEILKNRIEKQQQILKETDNEYILITSKIRGREEKITEIEKLKMKIAGLQKCPTCLQNVNEEHKRGIILNADNEVSKINQQNNEDRIKKEGLEKRKEQIKNQIQEHNKSLSEAEIQKIRLEGLKEKEVKVEELEKQKVALNKDINLIIEQMRNFIEMIEDFDKYSREFEDKNRQIEEIISEENSLLIKKAEINKEIQFLEHQVKILQEEILKLEEIMGKMNYLKELESWLINKFAQFIAHTERNVMLKLREEFSELFSKWFSILVPEELAVKLDESFSPIIMQQDYEIDYGFLSGGERTAVALAYRLALNQVINSLLSKIKTHDIVILDEPTDGFSDSQLDKMRDIFSQLKVKQLILVSHEQKMESFVDNIIRFRKIGGVTEIEK